MTMEGRLSEWFEITTADNRLRVSLLTPIEEPHLDFIKLSRVFEEGEIEVQTFEHLLEELKDALIDIAQIRKRRCEAGGFSLIRRSGFLHIRKVAPQTEEENPSSLLVLDPTEVEFLIEKLPILIDLIKWD